MCVCTCVDQRAWCVLFLQRCKTFVCFFSHIFGFNESSGVLLATCSLLNNFCGFSDLFISLSLINFFIYLRLPYLSFLQCPTHVSGRTLN